MLARPRLSRVQQLEQRALTEQIQILAEEVLGVAEFVAAGSNARPAIFESCEPMVVPGHRPSDLISGQQ